MIKESIEWPENKYALRMGRADENLALKKALSTD